MTTAEFVIGSLCGAALLCMFIGNGVALYFGYTKTELLLESFKNSSSSITNVIRVHPGPWGKLQLVGSACGVLTFPRFFIKHGILDAEDLDNFPLPFRRKLVLLQWSVIGSFSSLALLVSISKSGLLK
jgi:hypothetical protein